MPVSVYHKVAFQVTDQLSAVKESKINSSTKIDADSLKEIDLSKDEEFVSFDVTLLQTNVPDNATKDYCTNLLHSAKYETPPVTKETFRQVLKISSYSVLMLTYRDYLCQVDSLTMGNHPASLLAKKQMNKYG